MPGRRRRLLNTTLNRRASLEDHMTHPHRRLSAWIPAALLTLPIVTLATPAHAVSTRTLIAPLGAAADDQFGVSVSGAGDVNGDGYADVIVGAPGNAAAGSAAGGAYIFYGGPSAGAVAGLTLTGEAANDNFGFSVSGAGDVNGDGYADVIVGAYL
jgi:hypothetical protein